MKRVLIISGSLLVIGLVLLNLKRPQNDTCIRLQARVDLSERFCQNLGERAAQERCSALSDNPEVMGQCMRIIVPAAYSSCMDYLNNQAMKNELRELCHL